MKKRWEQRIRYWAACYQKSGAPTFSLLCSQRIVCPTTRHVDKGVLDGRRRGDMNWIKTERCRFFDRVGEKVHRLHQERRLLAVKLVTRYLSKEEKQVSLLQLLVAEGNEKADEFVNVGSMMDGGEMVEVDACSVQQTREHICAALKCNASFRCLVED